MSKTATPGGRVQRPVRWSDHARSRWTASRTDVPGRDREQAYHESIPVDYPPARDDARARYHREGDCLLLVQPERTRAGQSVVLVVTVIDLMDRPTWQQAYVRAQARYGGVCDGK